MQECLLRTMSCYESGRFPAQRAEQQWTVQSVNHRLPLFTVATECTFEKWYAVAVPGRMHVDDVRSHADCMVESPWRELMLPHQVQVL